MSLSKLKFYQNEINRSTNKQKCSWGIVNKLTGRKSCSQTKTKINNLVVDGIKKETDKEIADFLNNYFANIAEEITSNITSTENPLKLISQNNHTFYLFPTDLNEIKTIIKTLRNPNSSGVDEISLKLITNCPNSVLNCIVDLVNESFAKGIFPENLKTAIVIPLYKGGEKTSCSSYRPISLLPTLSKIIESLVKIRLLNFLNKYNLLSIYQFGFRADLSTRDAIRYFLLSIYKNLNNNQLTCALFCDLSKAFDTIDYTIRLNKLSCYDIRGLAFSFLESYLA